MKAISDYCKEAHKTAVEKGWWDRFVVVDRCWAACGETMKQCELILDVRSSPYALACRNCGLRVGPDLSLKLLFEKATARNRGELIALIHSELSEALEAMRKGEQQDEHCPNFSNVGIEFADALIRIFDMCEKYGYRLEDALEAKMAYNKGREYRHGKKF